MMNACLTFLKNFEDKLNAEPWDIQLLSGLSIIALVLLIGDIYLQIRARLRTRHNPKTGLLSLPPELRNIIWGYTVINPGPGYTLLKRTNDIVPAIARTCQQTRAEMYGMHFVNNDFRFVITNHNYRDYTRFRHVTSSRPKKFPHRRHLIENKHHKRPLMRWIRPPRFGQTPAQIAARKTNLIFFFQDLMQGPWVKGRSSLVPFGQR